MSNSFVFLGQNIVNVEHIVRAFYSAVVHPELEVHFVDGKTVTYHHDDATLLRKHLGDLSAPYLPRQD